MHWFDESRFGMFLHWGLYSLAARHEWVKNREKLDDAHYDRYFRHFDPDLYDPDLWAREAKAAGMKYMVLTTKHHEGFCLWPSDLTDYTVANTPYGEDLVQPFVEACRRHGLKVGFYHSLIDWHHPDFAIDGLHPQRDDDEAKAAPRDMDAYVAYLHGQVEELLTRYGTVDYLFFDFSYFTIWGGKSRKDWHSEELLALVRRLQPDIIVNERLDVPGDFVTPEQYQPAGTISADGKRQRWEACQTLNGSWGYDRDNNNWKSSELLLRMLVDGVSKGGNLLLNVGPNGRGEFEPTAARILAEMGEWLRLHGRSIYGAEPAEYFEPPQDCRLTQRDDRLYLHIFSWPLGTVHLPGGAGKIRYAQFLHDASEVTIHETPPGTVAHMAEMGDLPPDTLTLNLPIQRPEVAVPVIELFLAND